MNRAPERDRGPRWWFWPSADGLAHARRFGERGRALCGEVLDPRACYDLAGRPRCPRCTTLAGEK